MKDGQLTDRLECTAYPVNVIQSTWETVGCINQASTVMNDLGCSVETNLVDDGHHEERYHHSLWVKGKRIHDTCSKQNRASEGRKANEHAKYWSTTICTIVKTYLST